MDSKSECLIYRESGTICTNLPDAPSSAVVAYFATDSLINWSACDNLRRDINGMRSS
jgi:hypothetical protein